MTLLFHHEELQNNRKSFYGNVFSIYNFKNTTWHGRQPSMWFCLSYYIIWLSQTGGQLLMSSPDVSLIVLSTLSWSPPNDPDILLISSQITRKFHSQCVTVIARVFIWQCMAFVLLKHWWWLINGGGDNGGIIMAGNWVLIKSRW